MDYNHDCKKMFTQGQVDRMIAALNLPSRITLWSQTNLEATGCVPFTNTTNIQEEESIIVFPNPAKEYINFKFKQLPERLSIYSAQGKLLFENTVHDLSLSLNTSEFTGGIYFYFVTFENTLSSGKFMVE